MTGDDSEKVLTRVVVEAGGFLSRKGTSGLMVVVCRKHYRSPYCQGLLIPMAPSSLDDLLLKRTIAAELS
jgi:hypothetical protein